MFNLWLDIDFVRDLNFWGVSRVEKTVSRIKFWTFSRTKLFLSDTLIFHICLYGINPPSFPREKTWQFCKSTRRPFFTKKNQRKSPRASGTHQIQKNSKDRPMFVNVCNEKCHPGGSRNTEYQKKTLEELRFAYDVENTSILCQAYFICSMLLLESF